MKKTFTVFTAVLSVILLITVQAFPQADVTGSVYYHLKPNRPVPSAEVQLIDVDGIVVANAITELNGSYLFPSVPFGTYTLQVTTEISAGGVTMGDAFLMFMHLLGIYPFSPIQQLAADVDGDGSVTWNDYWTVVLGWFIQGYPFPVGPWVFQDVTFDHTGAKSNVPTLGGSSAGDVNGTFVPTTRDFAAIEVGYEELAISSEFDVNIKANDLTEAAAMGMVIRYPENLVNISDISSPLGELNMSVSNGEIRINWINQSGISSTVNPEQAIVTIKATTTSGHNGEDIRFELDPASHFSNASGDQIGTSFTLPVFTSSKSYLNANFPNPFNGSTSIAYTVPVEGNVSLKLFNQNGQLVRNLINETAKSGSYVYRFNADGLDAGVYYYTLNINGIISVNETKRMIITR